MPTYLIKFSDQHQDHTEEQGEYANVEEVLLRVTELSDGGCRDFSLFQQVGRKIVFTATVDDLEPTLPGKPSKRRKGALATPARDSVVSFLRKNPNATSGDVAAKFFENNAQVARQILGELIDLGLVSKTGKARWTRYSAQ